MNIKNTLTHNFSKYKKEIDLKSIIPNNIQ